MLGGVLLGVGVAGVVAAALTMPGPRSVQRRSPDGRLAVLTVSDTAFGQVEVVQVVADPGTPAARTVFTHRGDVPLRFVRWRDGNSAELEAPARNGVVAGLLLSCDGDACRLREVAGGPR